MIEQDCAGQDNPIGDLTLPRTSRSGARNHALSGRAARPSQNAMSTLDITPVFTVGFPQ
ncbi:hypothetical protein ACGFMK_45130 [Amycolatopsis sp. NPDC049252]|uniref:hypothetical protein n=1 Tax=Amycolatopsis sp. NPDC049252 TaxID=3363933 RepID=UPI003723BC0B